MSEKFFIRTHVHTHTARHTDICSRIHGTTIYTHKHTNKVVRNGEEEHGTEIK